MTETRNELFERGYRPGCTFPEDNEVIDQLRCSKCKHGRLRGERWFVPFTSGKQKLFTVCRKCGNRRPF